MIAPVLAAVVCWLILRNLNRAGDEHTTYQRHQVALEITVIQHAVEQAKARYPAEPVTAELIAADVAQAIANGWVGDRIMVRGQSIRGAKDNSKLAWTDSGGRVYVVRPDGANRVLVITALPSVVAEPTETAVARALRRAMVA